MRRTLLLLFGLAACEEIDPATLPGDASPDESVPVASPPSPRPPPPGSPRPPPGAPRSAREWNAQGRAQLRGGDRRRAIASFRRAASLDPASSWARNNLGYALLLDGRPARAVAVLEEAVSLDGAPAVAWSNLSRAYARCDRLVEARVALERAAAEGHPVSARRFARLRRLQATRGVHLDLR